MRHKHRREWPPLFVSTLKAIIKESLLKLLLLQLLKKESKTPTLMKQQCNKELDLLCKILFVIGEK